MCVTESAGELLWPAGPAIRQQGRTGQAAAHGAAGRQGLGIPMPGQGRRPGDLEMDAGELGEECVKDLAVVLADQLPILLLEERFAKRAEIWRCGTSGIALVFRA